MRIDFVSDVSCPWCVIGLYGVEEALRRLKDEVEPEIHFQPFELNPHMPAEGQDLAEHIKQKYGSSPEESSGARENIRSRGAELGFTFNYSPGSRIYNTFDAHRLLHWAELEGRQRELKHALFKAYFTDGQSPGDHEVLARVAASVGLAEARARESLPVASTPTRSVRRSGAGVSSGSRRCPPSSSTSATSSPAASRRTCSSRCCAGSPRKKAWPSRRHRGRQPSASPGSRPPAPAAAARRARRRAACA